MKHIYSVLLSFLFVLAGCDPAPQIERSFSPESIQFSGTKAYQLQKQFVRSHTRRHSGTQSSREATLWLAERMRSLGWQVQQDRWQVTNYSKPVSLCNVVCTLPGRSSRQIVVVAHHDQSPLTIEGADNDGSGIAILLHLAEIARSFERRYTLVFLFSDGEEYGMLGALRYVQRHPATDDIIAAISLDNLGKKWSNGMDIAQVGQFRRYGALWLAITAVESAKAVPEIWTPRIRSPLDQVLQQAVPVSFMDQGPFVARGVAALGFATLYPAENREDAWRTYHSEEDLMVYQSPAVLEQSGRICEALLRQLSNMEAFPREQGPYLYFPDSRQVFRGFGLWTLFVVVVATFFAASYCYARRLDAVSIKQALYHFLALWIPLVLSIGSLYVFIPLGLMDEYYLYPATARDPAIFHPRWPAVVLFLVILSASLCIAQRWKNTFAAVTIPSSANKSLTLLVIGIAALYVLWINPFSLLFFVPLWSWFFIDSRRGFGKVVDIVLFLGGGIVVYALFYFFGFVILRNDWAILWYLLMMFSIRMIAVPTMLAITAIVAAGLTLLSHNQEANNV